MMELTMQAKKTAKPQIQIKRLYQFDISTVWNAITSKEALTEWLMETDGFELVEGHGFQFRTSPRGGFDGIVNCTILEVNDPNYIAYHWQSNNMKNPTTVTWQLQEVDASSTMLTLTHTGFEGLGGWLTKLMLRSGWKSLLSKKLVQHLSK